MHRARPRGEEVDHPLAVLLQLLLLGAVAHHQRPRRETALAGGVLGMEVGRGQDQLLATPAEPLRHPRRQGAVLVAESGVDHQHRLGAHDKTHVGKAHDHPHVWRDLLEILLVEARIAEPLLRQGGTGGHEGAQPKGDASRPVSHGSLPPRAAA